VPTDCPQRDERLGWTGDAQAFVRTATFTRRSRVFHEVVARSGGRSEDNGAVPVVIPDVIVRGEPTDSSSGWGDVATIAPWTIHLVYGDTRILEIQYPSMKAWWNSSARALKMTMEHGFPFGDWLSYATTDPGYPGATTGKDLIATAFYAHSTDLLARTAAVLGREHDARVYARYLKGLEPPSIASSSRPPAASARPRKPPTCWRCSSTFWPRANARRRPAGLPRMSSLPESSDNGIYRHALSVRVLSDNGQLDTLTHC